MTQEFLNALRSKYGFGTTSRKWKHWVAQKDLKTCTPCSKMHGKIYLISESPAVQPPLHLFCRCKIKRMNTVASGECSKEGKNGADWWLMNKNTLPNYYISKDDLLNTGWYYGMAPSEFAPGKMMFGGVYQNKEGRLPDKPGRVWFEADLNYYGGKRNGDRLVWSNDGLFFVSYDHYKSFEEVIGG